MNQVTDTFSQGIFIDLLKEFHTVNHNSLLEKVKAYGIQSENLKGFRSYLSNRKQLTSCDNSKTEMNIVKRGVPQGSMLRPLFFLIFVKDLNNSTKVLDSVLFADNTNLYCSDSDIRIVFEKANQELG